jgi:hypothetical protein
MANERAGREDHDAGDGSTPRRQKYLLPLRPFVLPCLRCIEASSAACFHTHREELTFREQADPDGRAGYGLRHPIGARVNGQGCLRQHGGVPDLWWDDVKNFFDPDLMGTLPDVSVGGVSVEDWQAVLDLVRSSGWAWEYREGEVVGSLPSAEVVFARPAGSEMVDLRVWPDPAVLAIFRPYSADSIDFDVDLRELQGQQRLDILCAFLATIGRRLGKPVLMAPEGDEEYPVLGFQPEADRVVLLADPRRF